MGGWRCHSPREGSERRGDGVFWTSRERQAVSAQGDRTVRSCMAPWCSLSLIPQMLIEDLLCPGHSRDTSLEYPSEKVTEIQSISRQPKAEATERIALASAEALHLGADPLNKKGRQILITLILAMPPGSWLKPEHLKNLAAVTSAALPSRSPVFLTLKISNLTSVFLNPN